jgi:hypothetical protein
MEYTKGDWRIHRDGAGNLQVFAERPETGNKIAKVIDNNRANAHLIAAAPDMYEALQKLMQGQEIEGDRAVIRTAPRFEAIKAGIEALAKAEGKGVQ